MSNVSRLIAAIAVAGLLAPLSACSDAAGPQRPAAVPHAAHAGLLSGVGSLLSSLITTNGITRQQPLAADISVSATIGSAGGVIEIPAAGLRLTIPAGALSAPTAITATAVAGRLVAYEFAPHGLVFAAPVKFQQSTAGLNVGLITIVQGGYFLSRSDLDQTAGTAVVQELLNATIGLGQISFTIKHFSGYMPASGRDSTDPIE
jgi:hypothetical protein